MEIDSILFEDSNIGFLHLEGFDLETVGQPRSVYVHDSEIRNIDFEFTLPFSETTFTQVVSPSIRFENLIFTNFTMNPSSQIFKFSHACLTPTLLSQISFSQSNGQFAKLSPSISNDVSLLVQVEDFTASELVFTKNPLFSSGQNGRFEMRGVDFQNNYGTEIGAFLQSVESDDLVQDSLFRFNSGMYSALFVSKENSMLTIRNSTVSDNFALYYSVFTVDSGAAITFENSTIERNYAQSVLLGVLTETSATSYFRDSLIRENALLTKAQILGEFSSCSLLCWLNPAYSSMVAALDLFDESPTGYDFQIVKGIVHFEDVEITNQQTSLVSSFIGEISVVDSSIHSLQIDSSYFKLTESSLFVSGSNFTAIQNRTELNPLICLVYSNQ